MILVCKLVKNIKRYLHALKKQFKEQKLLQNNLATIISLEEALCKCSVKQVLLRYLAKFTGKQLH